MKQILYVCDLCGTKEENTDDGGIVGLTNDKFEYQLIDLDTTSVHLCVRCLKKLTDLGKNFFENIKPDYNPK